MWFEKEQALALTRGSIDAFFTRMSMRAKLQSRVPADVHRRAPVITTASSSPTSTPAVLQESGRDGLFQHYGVFLPTLVRGEPTPLQLWLHWRGGHAHSGAAVVPKVFKQFGEDKDTIVVAPSGRGTSTWYVGRGHVDYREVWKDVSTRSPSTATTST